MKDTTREDRMNCLRSCWARGNYTATELKPVPGTDPRRMHAYQLPSRSGDRLYWPDGRITDLEGRETA